MAPNGLDALSEEECRTGGDHDDVALEKLERSADASDFSSDDRREHEDARLSLDDDSRDTRFDRDFDRDGESFFDQTSRSPRNLF